jgi:hypothetical protein
MICTHDIIAKDNACADGMCPICLAIENKHLHKELADMRADAALLRASGAVLGRKSKWNM